MSFLTPLAAAGALLAVPVVLLYMLRLRRREITVSSTFLWQQILLDREANTPWQRLKRNLLLFLQLLILALLVFALMRPFIIVPTVSAGQIALLLDASASMNAEDSSFGTRFDEARARALELVNTMGPGDTMTVIRVSEVPEVLAPYTGDQAALREAINRAQPSLASGDWSAALTLAAAGAAGAIDFDMVLLSDGNLGEAANLPAIPGEVQLLTIGESSSNVAITALATRALPGQAPQLFAQVTNYGAQDAEIIFDLRVDGELFTARPYTVRAGEDLAIVSDALPEGFGTLQAGLTIPVESTVPDYLSQDNSAWAVSSGTDARRVLVFSPEPNYFIGQVLRSLPGVEVSEGNTTLGVPNTPFDLYIFDSWLPDTLPQGDIMVINPPSSTGIFSVSGDQTDTANIVVRRDDPRMTYVDFDSINIESFRQVSADWAEALITSDGGPLLLAGDVGGRQVAVLTFDLYGSDLPLQITWPILMGNLINWYQPQDVVYVPDGLGVGESLLVRPPLTAEAVRVTLPDGQMRDLAINREALVFAETRLPGIYRLEISEGGEITQSAQFAVNLFDSGESDITPQSSITLGSVTVEQAEEEEIGQREFWPWLALVALAILMLEWYAYHRRLKPPTLPASPAKRRARA
jgi:Ca-activated chloride channel homolog